MRRQVGVAEGHLQLGAQVLDPDVGARTQRQVDVQRHRHGRAQLDVVADQAHGVERPRDAPAQRGRERAAADGVDGHAHHAPAAAPGVAGAGVGHAGHAFGLRRHVGQRHRAQLQAAVGLGRAALQRRHGFGRPAVGHVERVPDPAHAAAGAAAARQHVGADVAGRALAAAPGRGDGGAGRQRTAVDAVAEAQLGGLVLVHLDEEVLFVVAAVDEVGTLGPRRSEALHLHHQRRARRRQAVGRRRAPGQHAGRGREAAQHRVVHGLRAFLPAAAQPVAVVQRAQAVVVGRRQRRAGRQEARFLRPPLRDVQQVAVEQRQVALQRAVAVGHEAVGLRERVVVDPEHAHEPGAGDGILQQFGALARRPQAQQLAPCQAAAGGCAGGRVQCFLEQQLLDARVEVGVGRALQRAGVVQQRLQPLRRCQRGGPGQHQVGAGAAGGQRGDAVAPGVQVQRVQRGKDTPAPARAVVRQREDHGLGVAPGGAVAARAGTTAVPHRPLVEVAAGVAAERRQVHRVAVDLHGHPGAGLVALVQVVVDQPAVARERDPLARSDDAALGHHAVVVVGQLVGLCGDQVDQRLVEIGFAGGLPAGHAVGHRRHQQVAEAVVVAREGVDGRRRRLRRGAAEARGAGEVEAAGAELERQAVEQRVHGPGQRVVGCRQAHGRGGQHVAAVVAHRRHLQPQAVGAAVGVRVHLGHLHQPRRTAGPHAHAAADAPGRHRRQRGQAVGGVELHVQPGEGRRRGRVERHDDQPQPVVARGREVARPVGQAFFAQHGALQRARGGHGRFPGCCRSEMACTAPLARTR